MQEIVEATLQWCNDRRIEQGKEPLAKLPKGRRRDPTSCPCGEATDLAVGMYCYLAPTSTTSDLDPDGADGSESLPPEVQHFVELFDTGALPEYELNPES